MPRRDKEEKKIHADPLIRRMIKDLADRHGVPESQIWNYFAAEGLLRIKEEISEFWERLKDAKDSNRYKKQLDYDDIRDLLDDD
jgi:hypothetical protein